MNIYFQGALSTKEKYLEPSWVQNEVRCEECGRLFLKELPDVSQSIDVKIFGTELSGVDLLLPRYNGYPIVSETLCKVFQKFGDPILEIPAKVYVSKKHGAPVTQVIDSMRALFPLRSICLDPLKSRQNRIVDCPMCGGTSWRVSGKKINYDFSGESIRPNFFSIYMYEAMPFYSEELVESISDALGMDILEPNSALKIGHWG